MKPGDLVRSKVQDSDTGLPVIYGMIVSIDKDSYPEPFATIIWKNGILLIHLDIIEVVNSSRLRK